MKMQYNKDGSYEPMFPVTLGDNVNLNNGQTLEQWKTQIDDLYNIKEDDDYNTIWTGSMTMNATDEVITLKPLTECENGWILVFKEPSGASGNINYCYVPKVQPDLYASFGIKFVVGVRSGGVRAKFLYINNLTITGHSSNATGGNEDTELVRVISY